MNKYDYGKFINTPVTESLRSIVKKLTYKLEMPMAEYVRLLIKADLTKRGLWPPKKE